MDGPHDLGGRTGFGSVNVETNEPTFHEMWEAKAWALNMVSIGKLRAYNADAYRHSLERMTADWYLSAKYYERMLTGVTTLLVEQGVLTLDEIEQRAGGPVPLADPVAVVAAVSASGASEPDATTVDDSTEAPRFQVGEPVVVTVGATPGHSRCPAYLRGQRGTIVRVYTRAYFPEWRAHGPRKRREFTYAVEFEAADLWAGADADQTVVVEVFQSYMSSTRPNPEGL
jgi:nitrile hydratase subunit beta